MILCSLGCSFADFTSPDAIHVSIILDVPHVLEGGMAKLSVVGPAAIVNFCDDGRLYPDDILACAAVEQGRALSFQPVEVVRSLTACASLKPVPTDPTSTISSP